MLHLPLLALVLGACSTDPGPQAAQAATTPTTAVAAASASTSAAPEASPAATAHDRTLLFFLNPSGRPCQMQDQIIRQLGTELTSRVDLRYVSIDDPSSRALMGSYGIRALPTLILVDSSGSELHRFPAGIRDGAAILAALE